MTLRERVAELEASNKRLLVERNLRSREKKDLSARVAELEGVVGPTRYFADPDGKVWEGQAVWDDTWEGGGKVLIGRTPSGAGQQWVSVAQTYETREAALASEGGRG